MTINLLPQQETEFIRQSFLSLLGSDVDWIFTSTLTFHAGEISCSFDGNKVQTYPWRVIRDILARIIELDQYPESSQDFSVEEIKRIPWFQNLASQYQGLLETGRRDTGSNNTIFKCGYRNEKDDKRTEVTGEEIQETR